MNPKNQILQKAVRSVVRAKNKISKRKPELVVEVPSVPTLRSLTKAILAALGHSQSVHNSALVTMYIHELFTIYGVERLILVEFHHMAYVRSIHHIQDLADWLVCLIRTETIEVEVRGLPEAQIVFNVSAQLARRFYMCPHSHHLVATTDLKKLNAGDQS